MECRRCGALLIQGSFYAARPKFCRECVKHLNEVTIYDRKITRYEMYIARYRKRIRELKAKDAKRQGGK